MDNNPDKSLTVGVNIVSGQNDAGKVAAQLKEIKQEAAAAGKSTGSMVESQNAAASAAENLGKKEEDAAKETGKLEISHGELKRVLRQIGGQVAPELGEALSAAALGPIGAVVALSAAFEFLLKKLAEHQQKLAEIRQENAQITTAVWDAQRQAIRDAHQAAMDYADFQRRQAEANKTTAAEELAQQQAILAAQLDGQRQLLAAQEAVAMAKVGDDQEAKKRVEEQFAKYRAMQDLKGEAAKMHLDEAALAKLRESHPAADRKVKDAEAAKEHGTGMEGEAGAAQEKLKNANNRSQGLLTDAAKAVGTTDTDPQALVEAYKKKVAYIGLAAGSAETDPAAVHAALNEKIKTTQGFERNQAIQFLGQLKAMEAAFDAIHVNQQRITDNQAVVDKQNEALQKLNTNYSDAEKAVQGLDAQIKSLTQNIETAREILKTHEHTTATTEFINRGPEGFQQDVTAAAAAIRAGRGAGDAAVQALKRDADAAGQNWGQLFAVLNAYHGNQQFVVAEMRALQRKFNELSSQMSHGPGH